MMRDLKPRRLSAPGNARGSINGRLRHHHHEANLYSVAFSAQA